MKNVPRSLPLIDVWNQKIIRKRIALEIKSGYGKGNYLGRIKGDGCDDNDEKKVQIANSIATFPW